MKIKLLFFLSLALLLSGCKKTEIEFITPMDPENQTYSASPYPCIKTAVVLTHSSGDGSRDYYMTYHYDEQSRLKQIVEYATLSGSTSDTMHKSITDFFYTGSLLTSENFAITFYNQPNIGDIAYSTVYQYDPNGKLARETEYSSDNSTFTPSVTDYLYEPGKKTTRTVAYTDTTLFTRFFYPDSTSAFYKGNTNGMWQESYVYSTKTLYIKAGEERDTVFFSDLKNNVNPEIWKRLDHEIDFDFSSDDREITPYFISGRRNSSLFSPTVTRYEFNGLGNVTKVSEEWVGGTPMKEYLFTY